MIYYGRNENEAAVQGGAVLSSGEPDRASYSPGQTLLSPAAIPLVGQWMTAGKHRITWDATVGCVNCGA